MFVWDQSAKFLMITSYTISSYWIYHWRIETLDFPLLVGDVRYLEFNVIRLKCNKLVDLHLSTETINHSLQEYSASQIQWNEAIVTKIQ